MRTGEENMRNIRFSVIGVWIFLLCLFGSIAYSDIPRIISYSGRLTDLAGRVVTTAKTLQFKIYDAQTGGTALWTSANYSVTPDSTGVFSVLLGSQSDPIGDTVFSDVTRYIEIAIEGTAMAPRLQLASGPYAFRSLVADTVADSSVTTAKISNEFPWSPRSGSCSLLPHREEARPVEVY